MEARLKDVAYLRGMRRVVAQGMGQRVVDICQRLPVVHIGLQSIGVQTGDYLDQTG